MTLAFTNDYFKHTLPEGNANCNTNLIKWIPPDLGFLKINCDASLDDNVGGTDFVIRNNSGDCLVVSGASAPASNILHLEATAVKNALMFAFDQALPNFVVESDSKILIDVINNTTPVPWSISSTIDDILYLKNFYNVVNFVFSFRKKNKAAHWVANHAKISRDSFVWHSSRPPDLESILYFDLFAPSFRRVN
ncbi:hypothetical protein Cni_G22336 [Canna indica]|uniref:RNase H type-1 domain-containing protein n=1 Tax=Canna indica TaxID=4628 RepID=A0AAQ3QI59_9LILI|nr:hypothetical protein Cni_G22336 [Canna indica]